MSDKLTRYRFVDQPDCTDLCVWHGTVHKDCFVRDDSLQQIAVAWNDDDPDVAGAWGREKFRNEFPVLGDLLDGLVEGNEDE